MRTAFVQRLTELAAANPKITLITGDLGFGVFDEFAKKFPKQYLNVGVAEQNMTGIATGMALEGRIIYTYSIGNFPTLRCLEQIRNDACYHHANVNIVAIGGGFSYGALGFSHHATEDLAILRALPEITVIAPGDQWETREATSALAQKKGVGYLRLDKSTAGETSVSGEVFQIGKSRTLREGKDFTLICTGGILKTVLTAHELLLKQGIACRVVSMHTLKPLDRDALRLAAQETGGILTIEEHSVDGGLGGSVAECCLEANWIPQVFQRIGLRAGFSTIVGSQEYLRAKYEMDENAIVETVSKLCRNVRIRKAN